MLRSPLLWASVCGAFFIIAGYLSFYSYFSEFLFSVTKMDFTAISIVLFIYEFSNIIGNNIAGKSLAKNANAVLFWTPLVMIVAYGLIFGSGESALAMFVLAFIVGIFVGMMNNATHFMITSPFPKAQDLCNGLFISVSNIAISVGVAFYGFVISFLEVRYIAISSILMLAIGLVLVFVRFRIER